MGKITNEDYEEVLADHRRLVKAIDVIINGTDAAPQASLVDLIGQIKELAEQKSRIGPTWVKAEIAPIKDYNYHVKVKGFNGDIYNDAVHWDNRFGWAYNAKVVEWLDNDTYK